VVSILAIGTQERFLMGHFAGSGSLSNLPIGRRIRRSPMSNLTYRHMAHLADLIPQLCESLDSAAPELGGKTRPMCSLNSASMN
jgi:hypothetical protein